MLRTKRLVASVALSMVGGCAVALAAQALPAGVTLRNGMFADANGMNVYVTDSDKRPFVSSCWTNCQNNWPPFVPVPNARDSGDWTIMTRDDGSKQWAYKTKPVYYFQLDRKPGDNKGDGVGKLWHAAKP